MASDAVNTFRQIGYAFGIAVFGSVFGGLLVLAFVGPSTPAATTSSPGAAESGDAAESSDASARAAR